MKSVLKYPGAKWKIVDWIVKHMPPHTSYLEPYFGSGAVFFNKAPSKLETINDINGQVVNLFRVLRERPDELTRAVELTPWAREEYYTSCILSEDPLESARRFLARCWMSFGGRIDERSGWRHEKRGEIRASTYHTWVNIPARIRLAAERLKNCQIENRPALEVIRGHCYPGTLIYADPPYPHSTRGTRLYPYEMTDDDHLELLEALDAHPGPVLLSGYGCRLYDDHLNHWNRITQETRAEGGRLREEILWLNPIATSASRTLFSEEG